MILGDEMQLIRVINLNTMGKRNLLGVMAVGTGLMLMFIGLFGSELVIDKTATNIWSGVIYRLEISLVAVVIGIVLHEALHGIFFKIYTGKVKFGIMFHKIMLVMPYATSQDTLIKKNRMIMIALAPQILTLLVILALFYNGYNPIIRYALVWLGAFNLGGGCMDIYTVVQVMKEKGDIYTEDTKTGMNIYRA